MRRRTIIGKNSNVSKPSGHFEKLDGNYFKNQSQRFVSQLFKINKRYVKSPKMRRFQTS